MVLTMRKATTAALPTQPPKFDPNAAASSPIPQDWTRNVGLNSRPLKVGMEVRWTGQTVPCVVRSVDAGGANVVSRWGNKKTTISLYAEVEYRSVDRDDDDWVDDYDDDVLGSADSDIGQEGGRNMARTSPIPGSEKPKRRRKRSSKRTSKSNKRAATSKRKTAPKEQLPCVCGCGGTTGGFFVPGHDARFKGWLKRIERGEGKPSNYMDAKIARKLGPWKKNKEGGQVPSKSYQDLR